MTNKERWESILKRNELPDDRLPVIEWSIWWDATVRRWENEGMPTGLSSQDIHKYFNLDEHQQFMVGALSPSCPQPQGYGLGRIKTAEDYIKIKKYLYPEQNINQYIEAAKEIVSRENKNKCPVSLLVHGFFWHPRELLGIEGHLYAFYDRPELIHEINSDLLKYNKRAIDIICDIITPDLLCLYEDMSYKTGSMISKEIFDGFLAPYYKQLIPYANKKGMNVFIDTDGNLEGLVPWYEEVGVDGVTPLERRAGVDIVKLLDLYPKLHAISGFDKMTMSIGEEFMRAEFERILPAMKTGRYIVSVDHQTPPEVSVDNYRIYLRLFEEYSIKAVSQWQI